MGKFTTVPNENFCADGSDLGPASWSVLAELRTGIRQIPDRSLEEVRREFCLLGDLYLELINESEYVILDAAGDWVMLYPMDGLDAYRECVRMTGRNPEDYMRKGIACHRRGARSTASELEHSEWGEYWLARWAESQDLESALQEDSWSFNSRYPLWIAIAYFSEYIQLFPDDPAGYLMRASVYRTLDISWFEDSMNWGERLWEEAFGIEDYTRAIALDPEDPETYFLRGTVYAAEFNGESDELAINDFTEVIRLAPDWHASYMSRAHLYGNTQQAIDDYTELIRRDPLDCFAYEARSRVYRELNDLALSDADERKCEELRDLAKAL